MFKTFALAIIFAVFSALNAHADSAFGIEYGGKLPSGAVETDSAAMFDVSNPPSPHSLFEGYQVGYTEETGVCYIMAYSETFRNDKYGTKAKSAYDKLVATLDRKYGPTGDSWEMLREDALWNEADEFAMSLLKGDREHARWFTPSADSQNEFDYVQIIINALSSSDTFIQLSYQNGSLKDKCIAAASATDDSSL